MWGIRICYKKGDEIMKTENVKSKGKGLAAVCLAGTLAAVSVFPVSAASYVENEREAWEAFADSFAEQWDAQKQALSEKEGAAAGLSLEFGENVKQIAEQLSGLDFSWLDSVGLEIAQSFEQDGFWNAAIGFMMNDRKILTEELFFDLETGSYRLRVPEISKSYLEIPLMTDDEEFMDQWENMKNSMNIINPKIQGTFMTDGDILGDFLKRYGNMVFDNMTEEESFEESVDVLGVEQSFTVHEGRIYLEDCYQLLEDVITEARDDELIKGFIGQMELVSPQENFWEEYQESAEELLQSLADEKELAEFDESTYISYKTRTDEDGRCAGREITFCMEGEAVMQYSRIETKEDDDTALRIFFDTGDGTLEFGGTGKVTDGSLNGNYRMSVDGSSLFDIEVTDYDVNAENGDFSGTYSLTYFGTDISEEIEALLDAAALGIRIEHDAQEKVESVTLDLMLNDERIGALSLRPGADVDAITEYTDGGTVYNLNDEEEMQMYMFEAVENIGLIIENCKTAGMPDGFLAKAMWFMTNFAEPSEGSVGDIQMSMS